MTISADKLSTLIDFHRYPIQCWKYHHGDVVADTIAALEELRALEDKVDVSDEVLSQLPDEDELSDIIDTLKDTLEMNKAEMIECIHDVLKMLEQKQTEMMHRAEYARDVWGSV